jgi:hypothetical protein
VGDHGEWLALQYLTDIWEVEPSVYPRPLCQPFVPETSSNKIQNSASASAMYITRRAAAVDPTCLADQHRYAAGAELIKVQPTINTQIPETTQPAAFELGPGLTLVGFDVKPLSPANQGGDRDLRDQTQDRKRWHISLYWQASSLIESDYIISIRPLRDGALISDQTGQPFIQDHQPVWNSYPTSRWSPGEVVRDDYVLHLPGEEMPDGAQVVVYRDTASGFENLGEVQLDVATDLLQ